MHVLHRPLIPVHNYLGNMLLWLNNFLRGVIDRVVGLLCEDARVHCSSDGDLCDGLCRTGSIDHVSGAGDPTFR